MRHSPHLNEQQTEATPPRKYELPEEDLKAGLMKRLSVALLFSSIFLLLKDVLFNWSDIARSEPTTALPESVKNSAPGNESIEPPSSIAVEARKPADQGDLEDEPGRPDLKLANAGNG